MERDLRENLSRLCTLHCDAAKLSIATLSQRAAGDWRWLARVLDGGNFSVRKYDEIVAWLSAQWLAEVPWPADVPRPKAPSSDEPSAEEAA